VGEHINIKVLVILWKYGNGERRKIALLYILIVAMV